MINIIDYGSGNLRSVYNAFNHLGAEARISDKPDDIASADKIVFPGQGSSKDALAGLSSKGLTEPMLAEIKNGKYFLGICLGLQLLFETSEEDGGCDCLNLIKGDVKRFPYDEGLKIPQIGWNTVSLVKDDCPLFDGVSNDSYFYFVHSYYSDSKEGKYTVGETEYGVKYTSCVWKENMFAMQFHPERSQANGLKILENFIKL